MNKVCLYCNEGFEAKKDTAKYCSTSCRVMFSRKNKGNGRAASEKSFLLQAQVLLNSVVEMVGKVNFGQVPTILDAPRLPHPVKHDEPLSFAKMEQDIVYRQSLPSFQDLLNGMADVQFADEKEDYAAKIKKATHLSEKQRNLLLTNLWGKD